MKNFKTYNEQINILKERGLKFENENTAKNILQMENYYFLINGYNDLFLREKDNITNEDKYLANTSFEEIYNLYNFDRKLRINIFEKIMILENNIKSLLAYSFPQNNEINHSHYLIVSNFNELEDSGIEKRKVRKEKIISTINKIEEKINQHKNTNNYINHYLSKHGYLPPWVLFKLLSFGIISNFLKIIKSKDLQYI